MVILAILVFFFRSGRGVPLTADELAGLEAGHFGGCFAPTRVAVGRGDVVLWRSDLVHTFSSPDNGDASDLGDGTGATRLRSAVFVSMAPAALTPDATYAAKMGAYQQLATGAAGSLPCDEAEAAGCAGQPAARPRGKYFAAPPPLTERQAQLFGLVRYRGRGGSFSESDAASLAAGESEAESEAEGAEGAGCAAEPDGLDGWSAHSVGRSRHGPAGQRRDRTQGSDCTDVARGAACGAVYDEAELLFCAPCMFY
jgi:hypothetical protein